ncbi:MAG: 5-formyltetrahydrofolate cyclo-ligase [Bacteroidota bacterium]
MLKYEARKIYREKREALTEPEKLKLDDLLLIQFQKAELPFLHTILSYRAIEENNEPDTNSVTSFLEFRNPSLHIAYPKVNISAGTMHGVLVDHDTSFQKGAYNVPEPISNHMLPPHAFDLILVPLLIFDKQGFRAGYGKGFYDKYLSNCRPDCIKAGLSYFDPIDEITDTDEFDVPLDLCITPQTIYVF